MHDVAEFVLHDYLHSKVGGTSQSTSESEGEDQVSVEIVHKGQALKALACGCVPDAAKQPAPPQTLDVVKRIMKACEG